MVESGRFATAFRRDILKVVFNDTKSNTGTMGIRITERSGRCLSS